VDDGGVLMLGLIEQTLEAEGYSVWTATPAARLGRCSTSSRSLDLVITEIACPAA
jgi:hypothetical protein